jgi:hypothetical protein
MTRQCGSCTLCCKLLPMASRPGTVNRAVTAMVDAGLATYAEYAGARREWTKPAGARCQHQRRTGCAIYAERPASCRMWSCRWLSSDDTAALSRPDRAHYVIDAVPDYVTAVSQDGEKVDVPVVVIWLDPDFPDAHRDPALRTYLKRRGNEGMVALIRLDERRGFVVFPPALSSDGEWHETSLDQSQCMAQHNAADIFRTLANASTAPTASRATT